MKYQIPLPKTQLEEVLFYLIQEKTIDRRSMMNQTGIFNLPEAIRKLRHNHGLNILTNEVPFISKFGIIRKFGEYSVEDKEIAIRAYYNLRKSKK